MQEVLLETIYVAERLLHECILMYVLMNAYFTEVHKIYIYKENILFF